MRVSRRIFPFIQRVFADSGYGGGKTRRAASMRIIAAPAPVSLWGFTLESGSGPVVM